MLTACCQVEAYRLRVFITEEIMTAEQIAKRLVELCRRGEFSQSQEELFAQNAVSIEPEGMQTGPLGNAEGMDAIRRKGKAFEESVEQIHGVTVSDPLVAGDFFSIAMSFDATWKQGGRRSMEEICLFEVRDGKIVREQFFYRVA
jgi:ketosteroid isomerase-like protein